MINDAIQKSFCSKNVWNKIRVHLPPVSWYRLVWHKARIPKHAFTVWLFVLNRNPTLERLARWGTDVEQTCLLCGQQTESRDHLFFQCPYSAEIWNNIVLFLSTLSAHTHWDLVIGWLATVNADKNTTLALLQAWHAVIYEVWAERNRRFHSGISLPPSAVLLRVKNACLNR